jgi:rfaE bifunctional protein kinase chain/domain
MKNITSPKRWQELVSNFAAKVILVIGDIMLDEYIWGEVERISPEAPVPVVRVASETWVPGGAANVANNICALGGRAVIAGLIGADLPGRRLKKLLRRCRIDTRCLVTDKKRPTITKSRVLAGHQQVIRIDREDTSLIRKAEHSQLMRLVRRLAGEVDGIVLQDYAKGVVSQELVEEVVGIAHRKKRFLVVDPNEKNIFIYRGVRIVTPNRREALAASGLNREAGIEAVGRTLLKKWGSEAVLVTLGEDGMCLFETRTQPYHIPTVAREVFDVSGAGDTVVSTVALSLAAGATLKEASCLANRAAGVVVGKLGTATVSREEVLKALDWQ